MSAPLVNSPPRHPASGYLRRALSESRPSHRRAIRVLALPMALTQAWDAETESENTVVGPRTAVDYWHARRAQRYGLPSNPRDTQSPTPPRTLRHTPDSHRLKLRQFNQDTISKMRLTLGERNKVDQHWLALNGHYGGMEAHYAAYEAMVEAELQNEALDLAISQRARKASLDQAQISVSRKGSAVDALALPEFTILGATPISAAQDMPSSPHAPFEWDNLEPFGPTSGTSHRPASVEDRQSTYRKISQPELEIELARKPRPATIQNKVREDNDAASVSTSKSCSGPGGRKRLGVILDGQAVSDEIEKRYGGGRL